MEAVSVKAALSYRRARWCGRSTTRNRIGLEAAASLVGYMPGSGPATMMGEPIIDMSHRRPTAAS